MNKKIVVLLLAVAAFGILATFFGAPKLQPPDIHKIDIAKTFRESRNSGEKDYSESEDCYLTIHRSEFFDFDKDGRDEVILQASDCYSGTGGANIQGAFVLTPEGKLKELPIEATLNGKPIYNEYNRKNFGFYVKDGALINIVPIYKETDANAVHTGGEKVITFAWNKDRFVPVKIDLYHGLDDWTTLVPNYYHSD